MPSGRSPIVSGLGLASQRATGTQNQPFNVGMDDSMRFPAAREINTNGNSRNRSAMKAPPPSSKGSRFATAKIIKKVKDGIKHNKYGDTGLSQLDDGWKRYYKPPKKSKGQKQLEKDQTKIVKAETKKSKIADRKQREHVKKQERKAPSGRVYSSTEIHEGINSKRAQAYRKKHGIPESDK